MIKLISREEVFYRSSVADHYIAVGQKRWCGESENMIESYFGEHAITDEAPLDHKEPFHTDKDTLDDFAVFGFMDDGKMNYISNRSLAFIKFFEALGIRKLYLADQLKLDWMHFEFRSHEKRNAMKQIVNGNSYCEAFEFEIDELETLLPLFNYSGRDSMPIIYFFPAGNPIPLAMFLCDDRNFHTSFNTSLRQTLVEAAAVAGLVMGGIEICSR